MRRAHGQAVTTTAAEVESQVRERAFVSDVENRRGSHRVGSDTSRT
jgi:hypothetical protein